MRIFIDINLDEIDFETKKLSNLDLPEVSGKIMGVFETKERAVISELSELTGSEPKYEKSL